MAFLHSRHTSLYYKIIQRALAKERSRGPRVYYDSHHIVPRSLGGTNKRSNLVLLTRKEHYVCHLLLVKMTEGDEQRKMAFAAMMLAHQHEKPFIYKKYLAGGIKRKRPIPQAILESMTKTPSQGSGYSPYRKNCLGRVSVTNGQYTRTIPKEDVDDYLAAGWIRGRCRLTLQNRRHHDAFAKLDS